jgi:hypothetical protein
VKERFHEAALNRGAHSCDGSVRHRFDAIHGRRCR